MAVTHVLERGWHSSLYDKFYDSEQAALQYDECEQMRRTKPAESALDELSAEELRPHVNGRMADETVRQALEDSKVPAEVFIRLNSWYVDCAENNEAMLIELRHLLRELKLVPPIEYDDWVRVASELKARGLLAVNEQAIRDQEVARLQKEIESRRTYSQDELEQLPSGWLERPGLR